MRVTRFQGPVTFLPRPAQTVRDERVCPLYSQRVHSNDASSTSAPPVPASVVAVAATASAFAALCALGALVIGALVGVARTLVPVLSGAFDLGDGVLAAAIARHLDGITALLPITLGAAVLAVIVVRLRAVEPHRALVIIGAVTAVGALAATQLTPPAGVLSHDLAAWTVLSPAVAMLVALAPWPVGVVDHRALRSADRQPAG